MSFTTDDFYQRGLRYIHSATDLHLTIRNLVRSAIQAAASDSGSLYLLRTRDGVLFPYILENFPDEYLHGCSTVRLGTQCCGRAALHKTLWVVPDMWTDPLFVDCGEAARQAGMRSGFSIPVLLADESCVGTLGIQYRRRTYPPDNVLELSQAFAALIAVALVRKCEIEGVANPEELLNSK